MAPPQGRPIAREHGRPGARLTGGEAAGRRLATLAGEGLRPTLGVVRAACFNILGPKIAGAQVADLFAGAGSLGLEALSRGARRATFVELQRGRAEVIRENLQRLGWSDRGQVVVGDCISWIRSSGSRLLETDLVLMDPPYQPPGPELLAHALEMLGAAVASQPEWDPMVVAEHHRSFALPPEPGALNCVRTARYGTTALSFYRRH